MINFYLLEVLEGVYFVQFKSKINTNNNNENLTYTVDQDEAWKTSNKQAAENMKLAIWRIYRISSKVVPYDKFPPEIQEKRISL